MRGYSGHTPDWHVSNSGVGNSYSLHAALTMVALQYCNIAICLPLNPETALIPMRCSLVFNIAILRYGSFTV